MKKPAKHGVENTVSIRDWELKRNDTMEYCKIEVPGILQIFSEEEHEECLKLLKAIVNSFINLRIQRDGLQHHYQRERKLWINYHKKQDWEWRCELEDITHLYYRYEGRSQHFAQAFFYNNPIRFESKLAVQAGDLSS